MSKAYTPPPVAPSAASDDAAPGAAPELPTRPGERIAKLLARAGVASRREVERLIEEGRVALNGAPLTTPATVLESLKGITVDGNPVKQAEATRLFAFHKPDGLITAERDPAGRPTIYSALRNALPPGTPRLMPVGRLDFSTEGLLLLTNDGELKRKLELPATGIPRTYRARTFGDITQDQLEALSEGIEIDGIRYGSINANMERRTGRNQWVEVTITEGKNREVRRVLEHLGLQVSRLLRTAYGPIPLADLPRGAAVEIRPSDVERFVKALEAGNPLPGPGAYRAVATPQPSVQLAARATNAAQESRPDRDRRRPDSRRPDRSGPDRSGPDRDAPSTPRTTRRPPRDGESRATFTSEQTERFNARNARPNGRNPAERTTSPRTGTRDFTPGIYTKGDDMRAPGLRRGPRTESGPDATGDQRKPHSGPYGAAPANQRRGAGRHATSETGPQGGAHATAKSGNRPYGNRPTDDGAARRPFPSRGANRADTRDTTPAPSSFSPWEDAPKGGKPTGDRPQGDRPKRPFSGQSTPHKPGGSKPPRGPRT